MKLSKHSQRGKRCTGILGLWSFPMLASDKQRDNTASGVDFKKFKQHFFIIKWRTNAFYFLVFFMTLSSNENDISRLRETHRGLDRFLPVGNRNSFSLLAG